MMQILQENLKRITCLTSRQVIDEMPMQLLKEVEDAKKTTRLSNNAASVGNHNYTYSFRFRAHMIFLRQQKGVVF
jgi:hypothetical protein